MAKAKKAYVPTGRPRGRPSKKTKSAKKPNLPVSNIADVPHGTEVSVEVQPNPQEQVAAAGLECEKSLFVDDDDDSALSEATPEPLTPPAPGEPLPAEIPSMTPANLAHVPDHEPGSLRFMAVMVSLSPWLNTPPATYIAAERPKSTAVLEHPRAGATNTRPSTALASAASTSHKAETKAKSKGKSKSDTEDKVQSKAKAKVKGRRTARKRKPIAYKAKRGSLAGTGSGSASFSPHHAVMVPSPASGGRAGRSPATYYGWAAARRRASQLSPLLRTTSPVCSLRPEVRDSPCTTISDASVAGDVSPYAAGGGINPHYVTQARTESLADSSRDLKRTVDGNDEGDGDDENEDDEDSEETDPADGTIGGGKTPTEREKHENTKQGLTVVLELDKVFADEGDSSLVEEDDEDDDEDDSEDDDGDDLSVKHERKRKRGQGEVDDRATTAWETEGGRAKKKCKAPLKSKSKLKPKPEHEHEHELELEYED